MANTIVSLTVPGLDQTDGPPTDVSGIVGSKTVEISGSFVGAYSILGSHDGVSYAPLLIFNSGNGAETPQQTTNVVVKFMKVRRQAQNLSAILCSVAGVQTTTNSFIALAAVPAGAQTGPLPSVDTWTVVPPTGVEQGLNAICSGDFTGSISLEGSLDNVNFSPLGAFVVSPGTQSSGLSPLQTTNTVRYVRLNVQPGTVVNGPINITLGGGLLATSSGGAGVQLVRSGVGINVDNTDPTNPIVNNTGVLSFNGTNGVVKGTLASIYTFGTADDPTNDNLFPMPSGNLRFPGALDWGAGTVTSGIEYFQNRATVNFSAPPTYELASVAANISGIGGNGCSALTIYELNDPSWNGSFGQIFNMAWPELRIMFSANTSQTSTHTAFEFARRTYFPTGGSPFISGGTGPGPGSSLIQQLTLWNNTKGAPDLVESIGGYGDQELRLYAIQNGPNGQWVTHWANQTAVPAAGDGPAWLIDIDSRFGRLFSAATLQAYQTGASVANAWGWRFYAWDGTATLTKIIDATVSRLLVSGGYEFPPQTSGTFPLSDATTALLIWDDTLQAFMVSKDAGAYNPLSQIVGKFSGAINVSNAGTALTQLGDPGGQVNIAINNSNTEYPTGPLRMTKLRVIIPADNGNTPFTVTLMKRPSGGAQAATTMTITVPGAALANTVFTDSAHPISFAEGDTFALQVDSAAVNPEEVGQKVVQATLEGSVMVT